MAAQLASALSMPTTLSSRSNGPARSQHAWRPSKSGRRAPPPARSQKAKDADVGKLLHDALSPQTVQGGSNLAYLSAVNFLKSVGIENQSEITRVLDIAMNPNSIFSTGNRKQPTNPHARKLDVEADLKPLVAFLQEAAGLSKERVAKVILAHPAVLSYRVEERLQPFFAYLTAPEPEGLGLSQEEAAGVVERRPSLLGVEVGGLRRMVGFLQESGTGRTEIVELLATTL